MLSIKKLHYLLALQNISKTKVAYNLWSFMIQKMAWLLNLYFDTYHLGFCTKISEFLFQMKHWKHFNLLHENNISQIMQWMCFKMCNKYFHSFHNFALQIWGIRGKMRKQINLMPLFKHFICIYIFWLKNFHFW